MSLRKDDWKYADELFGILGKTDESSQYEIFERILKELRIRKKDLMEESEKMGGFYVKMWLAIFSDVGLCIISIINSMRARYINKRK